jgi:hypothetical protein
VWTGFLNVETVQLILCGGHYRELSNIPGLDLLDASLPSPSKAVITKNDSRIYSMSLGTTFPPVENTGLDSHEQAGNGEAVTPLRWSLLAGALLFFKCRAL